MRGAMPSEPIQILLVEGDPIDARRLVRMLRASGATKFRLRRAHKLHQAKRHLQNGRADVVLGDLSLPDAQVLVVVVEAQRSTPVVPLGTPYGTSDDGHASRI